MTCTNQQVKLLMKELNKNTLQTASAKAGMDVKTARKYRNAGKLPTELKQPHNWNNRQDPFEEVWPGIERMLEKEPGLQAKTILEHLKNIHEGKFHGGQLRTLQRRFRDWRASYGKDHSVIFMQDHKPGRQSQSDYTVMNKLNITIKGQHLEHLIFHFMLVYSRWEYAEVCYSESFDSLATGFENASWALGCVAQDHRTDNLTAATKKFKNSRTFTDKWNRVLTHYNVTPSRNNPGESHENGSIEKSNDLFKNAVDQQLMLRGSRDFDTLDEYKRFVSTITKRNNLAKKEALEHEIRFLKDLPKDRWCSPKQMRVRVSPSSTVQVLGQPYSVPSRLISLTLNAQIYPDKIVLYYGRKSIVEMERIFEGVNIDYRHIIDSLIRKPGAFANYQYRESLFPSVLFRKSYDLLYKANVLNGHKHYLKLLHLAKQHGEQQVGAAIELLLETNKLPTAEEIKPLLNLPTKIPTVSIAAPNLAAYDQLRRLMIEQEVTHNVQ